MLSNCNQNWIVLTNFGKTPILNFLKKSICNQNWIALTNFGKTPILNFLKNHSAVLKLLYVDRQTNTKTETLICTFLQIFNNWVEYKNWFLQSSRKVWNLLHLKRSVDKINGIYNRQELSFSVMSNLKWKFTHCEIIFTLSLTDNPRICITCNLGGHLVGRLKLSVGIHCHFLVALLTSLHYKEMWLSISEINLFNSYQYVHTKFLIRTDSAETNTDANM